MKLTLMIEGSATVIAQILASLPADGVNAGVVVTAPPAMPVGGDDSDDGPVNVGAPVVDASGLPWDERIHAKTKATTETGNWRKRRGVDDATVAAVEAQLRAASAVIAPPVAAAPAVIPAPFPIPAAPMQQPAPAALPVPMMAAPQPMPAAAVIPPMPAPEPVAPVVAAVVQSPEPVGLDFAQFMTHLSELFKRTDAAGAPLVHADYLAGITNEISTAFAPQGIAALSAITDIEQYPAMITYAAQLMQRDQRW